MTPSDIYNRKFEKAVGGYKIEDVNRFLTEVGEYIDNLQAERDDCLAKLEFLAEKLEEYRADEESLREAVVSAHKLGESVMRDAKDKADAILAEAAKQAEEQLVAARKQSDVVLGNIRNEMATESYAMESMKASVVKFRRQILSMYERQIDLIHTIPFNEDEVTEEPMRPAHLMKQEALQVLTPESYEEAREGEVLESDTDEYEDSGQTEEKLTFERPKRTPSNFGPLLFGEDFNLTRKD